MEMLGLISVTALIIALIYAQIKWGPDYSKTFSRLIAQKQSSIIYYFAVFFIFLSLFSFFIISSFIPKMNLSIVFTWVYLLGVISQLICVIIPETGGYKTKIHLAAAGVMSTSVLAQIILLISLGHLSPFGLIVCAFSLVMMVLVWLVIVLKHNWTKYELALQSMYFISYLGALVVVYYFA